MEIARQWLEVQRATPSFVGDATLVPVDDQLLHGPLPAGLEGVDYDIGNISSGLNHTGTTASGRNRAATPRSGAAAAVAASAGSYRFARVPLHEQLLAKGKLYEQRKEAMRERDVLDKLSHLREPRVSEEAKKLHREEKIYERFRRLEQQKQEKAYFERKKLDKEDSERLAKSFRPAITPRARQASARSGGAARNVAEHLEAQLRRRDERASQIRMKYMMSEMAEMREVPSINPVSERLAARRREKEGYAHLSQLEAMIERDRLRQAALWEKQREKEIEESAHPFPKITLYAANLQREGDAAERLYNESLEQEARRVEKIQSSLAEQQRKHSHTPRITNLAARVDGGAASAAPIEDELMRRHLDAMAHREEMMRQQLERERERRTPAINPVSDTIASRLPHTARERLAQPKPQFVDANEPRFAPRINYSSSTAPGAAGGGAGAGGESGAADRGGIGPVDSYGQFEQRKAEKLRQLREEAEAREMAECTFQPAIHQNPNHHNQPHNMQPGEASGIDLGGSLVERSSQWLKRREAKLEAQREQQRLAAEASPEANPAAARRAGSAAGSGGGNFFAAGARQQHSPPGMDSFVERLEEGRRRRYDQYAKLYATGSSWTGEPTVPSAPAVAAATTGGRSHSLSSIGEVGVKSLRPPVGPGNLSGMFGDSPR